MTVKVAVTIRFNKLPQLTDSLSRLAGAAVMKAAFDIESTAKALVPVDTGNLKSSIQTTQEGPLTALVGPRDVDYAVYVEYGTSRMAAQPYMRPAAERVQPAFLAAMRQIVEI